MINEEDLRKELYLDHKNGFDMTDTINWVNKFDIEEAINKIKKMNKTERIKELEKRLWNKSKPAKEYPKDFYVIPTLEVIEMMEKEKLKKEIEND